MNLYTAGYVLDPSILKGKEQGDLLSEFLTFYRKERGLRVTCATQLYDALRSEDFSQKLFLVLSEWISRKELHRANSREWLGSEAFKRIRGDLLGIITAPQEFEVRRDLPLPQQLTFFSKQHHFGIIASGLAVCRKLKRAAARRLKIEGGGERFVNYLRRNGKLFLKKAARMIVGKVIGIVESLLPLLKLFNFIIDDFTEGIFVYIDG